MTGRSMFRVLRWAGLAAVAPVLWACNARTLEKVNPKPEPVYGKTFQQTINRNVDMLFLVDDSSSMRLSQDNLNRMARHSSRRSTVTSTCCSWSTTRRRCVCRRTT